MREKYVFLVTGIIEQKWKIIDFVCMDEKSDCIGVVDLKIKSNHKSLENLNKNLALRLNDGQTMKRV